MRRSAADEVSGEARAASEPAQLRVTRRHAAGGRREPFKAAVGRPGLCAGGVSSDCGLRAACNELDREGEAPPDRD